MAKLSRTLLLADAGVNPLVEEVEHFWIATATFVLLLCLKPTFPPRKGSHLGLGRTGTRHLL